MAQNCNGDTGCCCPQGQFCSTFVTGAGGQGECQGGERSVDSGRGIERIDRSIDLTYPQEKKRSYRNFVDSDYIEDALMPDKTWSNFSPIPGQKYLAPMPKISALPAPGTPPGTYDPGYLVAQPNGTSLDAHGNLSLPQGILVSKSTGLACIQAPCPGASMQGISTGQTTKSLPKKYTIGWNNGSVTQELASTLNIIGPAKVGCMDPTSTSYDPTANTQGTGSNSLGYPLCNYGEPIIPAISGPATPIYNIGEEVTFDDMHNCPVGGQPIGPDHPCVVKRWGTITGMDQSSLLPRYEIKMADDGSVKYIDERALSPFQPEGALIGEPLPVTTIECGPEEYNIPLSKLGGDDKCVDKTLVVVLGAIALYFLLAKDK